MKCSRTFRSLRGIDGASIPLDHDLDSGFVPSMRNPNRLRDKKKRCTYVDVAVEEAPLLQGLALLLLRAIVPFHSGRLRGLLLRQIHLQVQRKWISSGARWLVFVKVYRLFTLLRVCNG